VEVATYRKRLPNLGWFEEVARPMRPSLRDVFVETDLELDAHPNLFRLNAPDHPRQAKSVFEFHDAIRIGRHRLELLRCNIDDREGDQPALAFELDPA